MTARTVTILGSTGSIGDSTLDLLRRSEPGKFTIQALTANRNSKKLAAQAIEFGAKFVAIADVSAEADLREALSGHNIEVGVGPQAIIDAGERPADFIMAAIIGAAGLPPTLAAAKQGTAIGLANKECLVTGGDVFMAAIKANGTTLLPVDSEHNAIFQVLERDKPEGVRRLILTASGGPFRTSSQHDLSNVTRENALNHPVWSMGAKITIDSATLMNKGLELIEASYLFDRPSAEIDVIVHPQSIVHSMVEYIDGSILAQMGSPDMRTPIAYALGWPNRMAAPVERLDLTRLTGLTFFEPDTIKFPALRLAREALERGGAAPNVLNASNEVAVAEFLAGRIKFLDIARIVEDVLGRHERRGDFSCSLDNLDDVLVMDTAARETAMQVIKSL